MRKKLIGIAVIMILFCILGLTGCDNKMPAIERIKDIARLTLPKDAMQEFYYWNIDFQGNYCLYAVFKFEDTPEEFLEQNDFQETTQAYSSKNLSGIFDNVVPEEVRQSFDNQLYTTMRIEADDGGRGSARYFFDEQKLLITIQR